MKMVNKTTHCFLVDWGHSPNVMSKTILEELGLPCVNENPQKMLSFNKQRHVTIHGEVKDVTHLLHPSQNLNDLQYPSN